MPPHRVLKTGCTGLSAGPRNHGAWHYMEWVEAHWRLLFLDVTVENPASVSAEVEATSKLKSFSSTDIDHKEHLYVMWSQNIVDYSFI